MIHRLISFGSLQRYKAPPSTAVQVATYIAFPVFAAASGPLFGSTLIYDLAAVAVGQRSVSGAGSWSAGLGWTALVTTAVVAVKALIALRRQ